mgnify:CR=1 FL=1
MNCRSVLFPALARSVMSDPMLTAQDIDQVRAAIAAHAQAQFPQECCGLVVRLPSGVAYAPGENLAPGPQDAFVLAPHSWAAAEDEGQILAVVHSHPNASAHASMADRVLCERSGLPWLIMGWPSGVMTRLDPVGWTAPLIGREFHHGVLDCYSLIRDYYGQELGLVLPDYPRSDDWWDKGQNLYRDNFASAGFVEVQGQPDQHDVVLMRVGARVDNHAGVFVDGCFWHGCPKHGAQPKGNKEFWSLKLATNKARDRRVDRQLRLKGWRVMT